MMDSDMSAYFKAAGFHYIYRGRPSNLPPGGLRIKGPLSLISYDSY